jgi:hypothetical protein
MAKESAIPAAVEVPQDMRDLAAAMRKSAAKWMPVTGNTLDISGTMARAEQEKAEAMGEEAAAMIEEDVKRHVGMWERFCNRLAKNPKALEVRPYLKPMADDLRVWEASKARIDLNDTRLYGPSRLTPREWFWSISPAGRVMLVKQENERRASERRFRLAKLKASQAA